MFVARVRLFMLSAGHCRHRKFSIKFPDTLHRAGLAVCVPIISISFVMCRYSKLKNEVNSIFPPLSLPQSTVPDEYTDIVYWRDAPTCLSDSLPV